MTSSPLCFRCKAPLETVTERLNTLCRYCVVGGPIVPYHERHAPMCCDGGPYNWHEETCPNGAESSLHGTKMLLGVPAAKHRADLLRVTTGGGRVPRALAPFTALATQLEADYADYGRAVWSCPDCGQWVRRQYQEVFEMEIGRRIDHLPGCSLWSIILSHPTDIEAGLLGCVRLTWVANNMEGVTEGLQPPLPGYKAAIMRFANQCVRLGLLERIEYVKVPSAK